MKLISHIAAKEFSDRLRSGWILICLVAWLGTITMTSLFGLIQIGHIGVQGYERTTMSLLNLVQYLVPLLGLLVGHDLVVREREDRTINLLLAAGVRRWEILVGKFLGGAATLALPVMIGFAISGTVIGIAARDHSVAPFIKLAISGVVLGAIFCGVGLLLSSFCRSRIQALVFALVTWGIAVFAFDLIALGLVVSTKAVAAAHEIEVVCDATHVNSQADIHSEFDRSSNSDGARPSTKKPDALARTVVSYLWLNPVDVFRTVNLPSASISLPVAGSMACALGWILIPLAISTWRLNRVDL